MAHPFPSLDWMQAYAEIVAAHEHAGEMVRSLEGRYRFTVNPGDGFDDTESYDLVVTAGPAYHAEVADGSPAMLAVRADYGRWKKLLTGRADFVMSFLMRKIKVDGDLGTIRSRLSDAKPLLDSLHEVPTDFRA